MIDVVYGGSAAFDALLYPEQSPINQMYFQNQITNFSQSLNDLGRNFMEAAREAYQKINSSEAVMLARQALRAAKGIFHPNQIVLLETLEDLQMAQPVMQRWVMACPEVRELFNEQRCEGYQDTYIDVHPGTIGESHYDYKRVMSGVIIDDEEDSWQVKYYLDELIEGDKEPTSFEKLDILSTWDIARMFINKGQDPTSPYGSKL